MEYKNIPYTEEGSVSPGVCLLVRPKLSVFVSVCLQLHVKRIKIIKDVAFGKEHNYIL